MTQTEIDSALSKIRVERQKVLYEARDIILRNDRSDLLFLLIHQNHLMKVFSISKTQDLDNNTKALCRLAGDAYAYTLQLVFKYGKPGDGVVADDYHRLISICRFVNNGYELETMLKRFPFHRFGERLQFFEIRLDDYKSDEGQARIMEYTARQELDSALRQGDGMSVEQLITELFPASMDWEFLQVFGLTVQEVSDFFSALAQTVSSNLSQAEDKMPKLSNHRIDITSLKSFEIARLAYTLEYENFLDRFGKRKQAFRKFFLSQSLRRTDVDESELRHFIIWRRHLLRLDARYFTFSPEITCFSPNFGLHYALLEDKRTKDSYQAKRGAQFQARVESVLNSSGIKILGTNVDAKVGKRDIGDVDILAEDSNYYFNIECKGAILPLRVYFHDVDYIKDVHLPYLRDDKGWERKVVAREEWLNAKRSELGLSDDKPLLSLIISECPEVISHFSQVLCLSLYEFPLWYAKALEQNRLIGFDEFRKEILQKKIGAHGGETYAEVEKYLGLHYERPRSWT